MVGNDPFAGMNALEKDIAKVAMNTSQEEFDGDFNSEFYNDDGIYTRQKGEPIFAENHKNPLKNFFNKDTNVLGYQKKPTGILSNNKFMDFMSKIPSPLNFVKNMFNQDPNAPNYQTRSPNIDYSKLNTNNLNDFYDDNQLSDTYDTTRFDRAKKGSFGSYRTLKDYFNRNKSIVDTGKKAAIENKKARDRKAAEDAAAAKKQYSGPVTYNYDPKQGGGGRPDMSGRGKRSGFTNPGKGSYGPWKADGGIINLIKR